MSKKVKYYSLDAILEHHAEYNIIYGERSNGKTTAVLRKALENHINSGYIDQLGIVRRWEEDFKGKNGQQMWDGIVALGWVEELTNGRYNGIRYYGQRWFLCTYDEDGERQDTAETPFALGFSITSEEHYKSTSYPNIKTILFDEFITRGYYIPDEFVKFQNLLSTIIRLRDDVTIYMCGNTINKYCPYFSEMGLSNVRTQAPGTIDVYTYGDSELKVAVEYCAGIEKKKKASNKYFAFNNPKLSMITNGSWEIDIYPHLPCRYTPADVMYRFFVEFSGDTLEGEVVSTDSGSFIFYHRYTRELPEDCDKLVYTQNPSARWNVEYNMMKPMTKPGASVARYMKYKKAFYSDNEVGEIVRNYLMWCKQN